MWKPSLSSEYRCQKEKVRNKQTVYIEVLFTHRNKHKLCIYNYTTDKLMQKNKTD